MFRFPVWGSDFFTFGVRQKKKQAKDEWLVEMAATAALPSKAGVVLTDKAAAAVGPYNQVIYTKDSLGGERL